MQPSMNNGDAGRLVSRCGRFHTLPASAPTALCGAVFQVSGQFHLKAAKTAPGPFSAETWQAGNILHSADLQRAGRHLRGGRFRHRHRNTPHFSRRTACVAKVRITGKNPVTTGSVLHPLLRAAVQRALSRTFGVTSGRRLIGRNSSRPLWVRVPEADPNGCLHRYQRL